MAIINIDGVMLRKAMIAGSNELNKNKALLDSLNVFPVPDGDTGTNMALTVLVVAKEVYKTKNPNAYDVAKVASSASLRGARGNSGVILSQLFRGFAKGLENKDVLDANDIAYAFLKASETAYKAVMKPKEGTILTVASAIAKKAIECADKTNDIEEMMKEVIEYGNIVLDSTTDMLAELKQAGVVDAGGKGILVFLEGAFASINIEGDIIFEESTSDNSNSSPAASMDISNLEYGYCTEFFINAKNIDNVVENKIKDYLQANGDSIVVVGDEDIFKVHVHTEHPGNILEFALKIGSLSNLKIENMREQHSTLINFSKKDEPNADTKDIAENNIKPYMDNNVEDLAKNKDFGFIAVASGNGLSELFKDLDVDIVIEGGQSMNPSTDDILEAIDKINAKNIIILPNNKNIISTTKQAVEICADMGKNNIHYIPTKNVPQGITAMVNCDIYSPFDENFQNMSNAILNVVSGQITLAVRDVLINEKQIKCGDILCILEDEIVGTHDTIENGAKYLIDEMLKDGGVVLSIYYGAEVTKKEANLIYKYALEKYDDLEIEFKKGNQPLYHYLFAVE